VILALAQKVFGTSPIKNTRKAQGGFSMFNAKSDYAINKKNEGIVYRNGDTIFVYTLNDYLHDNPYKAPADFRALKESSDEDYWMTDRDDSDYSKRTVSFKDFDRLSQGAVPSREDELIDFIDHQSYLEHHRQMRQQMHVALATLTEKQLRRYKLHICDGLKVVQIVEFEQRELLEMANITHQSISESIKAAKKRIAKSLVKQQVNPVK